jgi:pantoate--beta-alanine ligase
MSSRNVRLSPKQRSAANVLFSSLKAAKEAFEAGMTDAVELRKLVTGMIENEPLARLDYVSIADPVTLEELSEVRQRALFSLAVYFGEVRLIDNMMIP